jgi:DNA polymerase III, alpha subunit
MNRERYNEITNSTGGEIKFHEQMIIILKEAGFKILEADLIRKAYIKRKTEDIVSWEEKIREKMGNELALDLIDNIKRNLTSMTFKTHMTMPLMGCFSDTCSICKNKVSSIKVGENGKVYCIPCSEKDEYKNVRFVAELDIGTSPKDTFISEK